MVPRIDIWSMGLLNDRGVFKDMNIFDMSKEHEYVIEFQESDGK